MPRRLLKTGSVELNHISARGDGRFYVAFTNQSREPVTTEVVFNEEVLPAAHVGEHAIEVVAEGRLASGARLRDGRFTLSVAPMGLTAVVIHGVQAKPRFQHKLLATGAGQAWAKDFAEIPWGDARAMILNFGPAERSAYVYLQADDTAFKSVKLSYTTSAGDMTVVDADYPFEFTVPLEGSATDFRFKLEGLGTDDRVSSSDTVVLRR
jgi:hypothetical protein